MRGARREPVGLAVLGSDRGSSGLAELDRSLPLAAALAPGQAWEVHDVRWTPGQRCRVALRGPLRAGAGAGTGFVALEVTPDGCARHGYRDDPALPGLAQAADATTVAALLGEAIGEDVRACQVEPVRYRPGSRCVLRYDVVTAAGFTRFYAKSFASAGATSGAARVEAAAGLVAALAAALPAPLVAPVTAVWPGLAVFVTPSAGCSASSVLAHPSLTAGGRVVLAHRMGGLLAALHSTGAPGVPTRSAADVLTAVDAACVAARHADPPLARRLDVALERLRGTQPEPDRLVLSHCGFRFGQVASASGRLSLLDLDNVAATDPARDVANALAHLSWRQVRHPGEHRELAEVARGFLAGYAAAGGCLDEASLAWWKALSLTQLAARRYRRLDLAEWPFVPGVLAELERLLPAARGPRAGRRRVLAGQVDMTAALRAATGVPGLEITSTEVLSEAPGRRRVVRYRVTGLDPARPVELIGKTFRDPARAGTAYANLRALAAGPFGAGELRVPEPVALLCHRGVLVYRSVDGVPLGRLASGGAIVAASRGAARWLARLHGCGVELPRRLDLAAEVSSVYEWATMIAAREPVLAGAATALAQRWAREIAAGAGRGGASVPLHKDFHHAHVLVGDRLTVIDLDEARCGDPTFDVAHFCGYLDLLPHAWAPDARAAFLEEYAAASGWSATAPSTEPRMAIFGAYTCLKIAKQLTVGSGPLRVPPESKRGTAARVLTKGLACLDG